MKPNTVGRASELDSLSHPESIPTARCGFIAGTILLSQDGQIPVEYLSPGDRIITRDAGMVRLEQMHHYRITARAISFDAGSLGDTRPDQDLILPAGQMVLIRDWRAQAMFGRNQALVRADALIDGEFIRDLGPQEMQLHQLQFATRHVLYAGGLELSCASPNQAGLLRAA